MNIGWYFARRVAAWFFVLAALLAVLLIAWFPLLPATAADDGPPAMWASVGPLFLLAAWITWLRGHRTGELLAAATAGSGFIDRVVPVLVIGIVLQVLFALPPGRMPHTTMGDQLVQRSVDGDLYLAQRGRGVLFRHNGAVEIVADRLPAEFRPAPHNPRRYRRQAFFTRAPRLAPVDAFDPWLLRWLHAALVVTVPAMLLLVRRGMFWWIGAVPLALPILLL